MNKSYQDNRELQVVKKHYVVDGDGRARLLCTKQHKPGTRCKRPHTTDGCVWHGDVSAVLFAEFNEHRKHAKREHARAMRKWLRELNALKRMRPTCAPAFRHYLEMTIVKQEKEKPVFTFTYTE